MGPSQRRHRPKYAVVASTASSAASTSPGDRLISMRQPGGHGIASKYTSVSSSEVSESSEESLPPASLPSPPLCSCSCSADSRIVCVSESAGSPVDSTLHLPSGQRQGHHHARIAAASGGPNKCHQRAIATQFATEQSRLTLGEFLEVIEARLLLGLLRQRCAAGEAWPSRKAVISKFALLAHHLLATCTPSNRSLRTSSHGRLLSRARGASRQAERWRKTAMPRSRFTVSSLKVCGEGSHVGCRVTPWAYTKWDLSTDTTQLRLHAGTLAVRDAHGNGLPGFLGGSVRGHMGVGWDAVAVCDGALGLTLMGLPVDASRRPLAKEAPDRLGISTTAFTDVSRSAGKLTLRNSTMARLDVPLLDSAWNPAQSERELRVNAVLTSGVELELKHGLEAFAVGSRIGRRLEARGLNQLKRYPGPVIMQEEHTVEVYCKLRTKAVEERPEVLLAYDPLRGKASISLELSL